MADNDVSFRQRAVIEFLVKEEIPAADIHHRLQRVYGNVCMGASSARLWVKNFKDGNTSIQDQPCSGRLRTASTEPNKKRDDKIIKEDRRVTLDAIATKLGIGHNAVQEMIGSLDLRKKCHRPHTARLTLEKTEKMGLEVLPYPPYSPDLAPYDYHLFGFVKNQMQGQQYETNQAPQTAVRQCLWAAGTELYCKGTLKLPERWGKCVQRNGDCVDK